MGSQSQIIAVIERIHNDYPAGFAAALHIRLSTPRYMFQGYPRPWAETYAREGMVVNDPTALWGFQNTGVARWSALGIADPQAVMARAASEAGLRYGFTVALVKDGTRSIASFARADREPSDAEMAEGLARVETMHCASRDLQALSPEDHARLRAIAVRLTQS